MKYEIKNNQFMQLKDLEEGSLFVYWNIPYIKVNQLESFKTMRDLIVLDDNEFEEDKEYEKLIGNQYNIVYNIALDTIEKLPKEITIEKIDKLQLG